MREHGRRARCVAVSLATNNGSRRALRERVSSYQKVSSDEPDQTEQGEGPWYVLPKDLHRGETVKRAWFARVWGAANLLGVLAHGGGIVYTLTQARMHLTMEIADARPYICNPDAAQLSDVYGVLQIVGLGSSSSISLGWVVVAFFTLSLGFHAVAATALLTHEFKWLRDNRLYHMYRYGLYHNLAPWRWLEYTFSASIMLIIMSGSLGVRELRSVIAQVGCMGTTILFGWLTDLYAHTQIHPVPTVWGPSWARYTFLRRWRQGSWRTRLQFHLFGYVPYALTWTLVGIGYANATNAFGKWLPDFVNAIVFGTFSAFTMFGVVQFGLQALPVGPSLYAWGELVYITLSFIAKAQMGFIIVQQALVEGAEYDELLFAKYNPDRTTCADFVL